MTPTMVPIKLKPMIVALCGMCMRHTIRCHILFGAIYSLFFVTFGFSAPWDREAAERAFTEAQQKRAEIAQEAQPSRQQLLDCARTYRLVYLNDPHYHRCDDALYEEGTLYREMGDKFGNLAYYRTAIERFRFLISDYGGSPFCPVALLHMGDLYAGLLEDQKAAQESHELLRTKYKSSPAAQELAQRQASKPKAVAEKEAPKADPIASVQNIRYWTTNDYTRVVIDMNGETQYQKERLSKPDRIFFDILNAKLNKELQNRSFPIEDKFVKQVRVAQNRPDIVRVVLDFSAPGSFSVFELRDPFRIVIDIHPEHSAKPNNIANFSREAKPPPDRLVLPAAMQTPTKATELNPPPEPSAQAELKEAVLPISTRDFNPTSTPSSNKVIESNVANSAKVKPPPLTSSDPTILPKVADPTSQGDHTLTRMLGLKIGRIVIDPGHGGHDTGTIGPSGLMEKDLVLSVALNLRSLLQDKLGAEVVLTRDKDMFVSLEERTAIANQHQADLFISIHANSSEIRSISGAETYYLDFARTESEREVAARENATTVSNIRDLENLVKKIAQADKSAESRELAAIVQRNVYSELQQLLPSARNRGVRRAPFIVLIGANMPSVLAELAFISNPKDEKILNNKENQACLAKALFSGIESYMKTLGCTIVENRSSLR